LKKGISIFIIYFFCFLGAHSQSIDSAFKYFYASQYEKAEMEFEKVLPFIEKKFGATDTSYYSFFLVCTGTAFEKNHEYDIAERYYQKARSVYEQIDATSTIGYENVLISLADLYRVSNRLEMGETLYLQALDLRKKLFGETNPGNVGLLNNIASLYLKTGKYVKAEPYYLQALKISENDFGGEDPGTVILINNLGALYDDIGNYEKAESLYQHALDIRKKVTGTGSSEYAISANNLAQLYYKMGIYDKAEDLYQQALLITGKINGEENLSYAVALNNMGALYHKKGEYEKAEQLYLRTLEIRKKILGENHQDYATSLNNLALLYDETGNYEKAGLLYEKALEIRQKVLGESHPDYATSLNNIALFYQETGKSDEAESLLKKALEIRQKVLGTEHPDYAVSLNNLALFYSDRGEYKKAESLLIQALSIAEKNKDDINPLYATSLNNLAGLYDEMQQYRKSKKIYLKALGIMSKVYGENHPDYAAVLDNLALLYQGRGYFDKSAEMFDRAMSTYQHQIYQQFGFLSEAEKEKYLEKVSFFFKTYQNFIIKHYPIYPALSGKAYDIELSGKGLLLNAGKQMRMFILSSNDSAAIRRYNSWMALRASLARQYLLLPGQQTLDVKTLEKEADDLEEQLTRIYSGKIDLRGIQNVHWQDVQKRLNPGEAAIEFACFPYIDNEQWTDSIMYAAILLRSGDSFPKIVPLFEQKRLEKIIQKTGYSDPDSLNALYRWANESNSLPGKGQLLYKLIWQPIEKCLDGIQTVYYSPAGTLHQLSFAAIPYSSNELLSDKYNLYQLSSTAQLTVKAKVSTVKKMVLFGGIDYSAPVEKMQSIAAENNNRIGKTPLPADRSFTRENNRAGSLVFLEGTKEEVEEIKKLGENEDIKSIVIEGDEADEESIKGLQGDTSPDVIHIATHGFFFTDPVKKYGKNALANARESTTRAFRFSDNPLMRSGLIFAGANHVWTGEAIPSGLDDGILTAYEVSNMYIPNTELVVLSACETGLGEVKGCEGVYGLQRSFRIAGAEYILMSLWQIPDYQTSELMHKFYSEWFSGKSVYTSLRDAQNFMKNKYPGEPYLWAAFVLVR
jgi:tetratricopeptide (TPR) repeat protein/CHAT domain-containing protein